jgi:hypothetical protein
MSLGEMPKQSSQRSSRQELFIFLAFFLNSDDPVHPCDSLRGVVSNPQLAACGGPATLEELTMMTFLARGGSLAALALALAFTIPATPAAAQEAPDVWSDARAEPSAGRQQMRTENRGGRAEARVQRSSPAPRAEPAARQAPQRAAPAARGFGADVVNRAQRAERAQQVDRRSEFRADRIDRRSEVRAAQVDRRSEVRANRIERRGDLRANRIEDRGDRRADQVERRGDIRAVRTDGRRDNFRDDRRDGRADNWRDGRRDGWRDNRGNVRGNNWQRDRQNWRRDDWRWNYRGRDGWDRRDFRRWDNGWRGNRSYNFVDYRRANRFVYRPGPYFAPYRAHRYNRFQTGFFLDSLFFQPRFFINDPINYRLPPVYGPYQWVRYYDDVMLVDIYTGEVVDVIHDFFW